MSVGITFGSLGDLIAVSEIAWSLGKALNDSRGSINEYNCLGKELENFSKTFQQVVALWQNYENCPELEELAETSKTIANETIDLLTTFRDKLNRIYGKSFDNNGSGNRAKDAGKKIRWLTEKNDIAELRRKLRGSSETITMLTLAANRKSSKLDAKTQELRSQKFHDIQKESLRLAQKCMPQLEIIERQMDVQVEKSKLILTICQGRNTKSVLSFVREIKCMLSRLQMLCLAKEQQIQRGLGTHWQHDPAVLEDALGNRIRLPLEMIKSWEMFDTWLPMYFEEGHFPGARKVARREFAIEDYITGKELTRDRPWSMCFLPGKKADMSMLFQTANTTSSCPGCKTAVEGSTEEWIICARPDCGIRFRRITKLVEVDPQPEVLLPLATELPPSRSPTMTQEPEDDPGDFRRVQLIKRTFRMRINQDCDADEHGLISQQQMQQQPQICVTRIPEPSMDFSMLDLNSEGAFSYQPQVF